MCPVTVIDTIEPKNSGSFPIVRDVDIQGGIQVQPTTAARDAIPLNNQKIGMIVYVIANSTYYQLTVTGAPGTWVTANLGSNTILAGDVTGTNATNSVVKIRGTTVSTNSVANDGYALASVGGTYVPTGIAPIFNVKNFGAKGDGVTDDHAAILAAISVCNTAGGGIIFFPSSNLVAGVYICSTPLNLNSTNGIHFQGSGNTSSELRYTGSGALSAITAASSVGLAIEKMKISCTNAGFTGTLLDLSSPAGSPSFYGAFNDVIFSSTHTSATLVNLNNTFSHQFKNVVFSGGFEQVYGISPDGLNSFSVGQNFESCSFGGSLWSSIHGVDSSWKINAVFEPTAVGTAGGIFCDNLDQSGTAASYTLSGSTVTLTGLSGIQSNIDGLVISNFAISANNGTFTKMRDGLRYISATSVSYTNTSAVAGDTNNGSIHWRLPVQRFNGLTIISPYTSDSTGGGTWFSFCGSGLNVSGGVIGSLSNSGNGLAFNNLTNGVSIHGVQFNGLATAITWGTGTEEVSCLGNEFFNCTNIYNGIPVTGIMQSAANPSFFRPASAIQILTPYRCRAYNSTTQTISSTGWIQVTAINTVSGTSPGAQGYDPNHNFASSAYTAPVTGYYHVDGLIFTNQNTTQLVAGVRINGSANSLGTLAPGNGVLGCVATVSDEIFLTAGDVVTLYGNFGVACTVQNAALSVRYVSS